ncbi:hypothetical protein H4582DRAFT_1878695 [Lactarius indigo]|nr:hypothetical protein H4582DRAFT_1878695 [Lactarius indigo]
MNIDEYEDGDEDEDEEDETGPGYILNLGIPHIQRSVLWVRKEYIRLYGYCDKYLESLRHEQMPPSVVITGQPGIGKSYWITYALCRRLAEGKPVIWFRTGARYLFVAEGVFKIPSDYPSTEFKTRVWMLLDADDCKDGIPDYLAAHETNHLIILSSSPKSARWKLLSKTTQCSIAIMNPWTREEISQAAVIRGLTASNPRIDDMYYHYGPTPRICLDFVDNVALFIAYKAHYRSALNKLSSRRLGEMDEMGNMGDTASDRTSLDIDDESHTLILVKRVPRRDLIRANLDVSNGTEFSYGRLEPITQMIKLELRNQLQKETRAARIALYKSLENVEGTRRIAGVVYESLAQSILEKKIALELVPMVKWESSGSDQGKKLPRWHSDHESGANPPLVRPIDIRPAETFLYPVSGLDHPIKDKVYYAPEAQNQVAFDSFIMAERKLYIFQFSIGSDHPIKKGIVPFFSKKVPGALPPRAEWHFVFVIPPRARSEISCSQPRDSDLKLLLKEMNLFSALLDCEAD